jgi:hypothetical protein
MHARVRIAVLKMAWAPALAIGCAHSSQATFSLGNYSDEIKNGIERVRTATARFASLDSAVAAGYPREVPECYANGPLGAMGFHHVNRSYVDSQLDLEKPEILIYERLPDGRYTLNAVEFIIPYSLWSADSAAPVLLGRHLRRYDDLRIWSIHMWIWKENPSGLFADWNPNVHCLQAPAIMAH